MHWADSLQFWWLIPVLLFLMCFVMCFVMRGRGIAGCCTTWRGSRDRGRDLPTDSGGNRHFTNDPTTLTEDKTQTESLKTTVQGLEQRLRSLEAQLKVRELSQALPCSRS